MIVTPGAAWFQPSLPRAGFTAGIPARPNRYAVPVDGVNRDTLLHHSIVDGAVTGYARMSGVWGDERLTVREQDASPEKVDRSSGRVAPPCPEPATGWPSAEEHDNLSKEVEAARAGGEVVDIRLYRPSARQVVLGVASTNPQLTRKRLSGAVGGRLCVVRSRFTRDQIEQAGSQLESKSNELLWYESGPSIGEDCQPFYHVKVSRVVPAFVAYARPLPDGLLRIQAWLRPQP